MLKKDRIVLIMWGFFLVSMCCVQAVACVLDSMMVARWFSLYVGPDALCSILQWCHTSVVPGASHMNVVFTISLQCLRLCLFMLCYVDSTDE
jgi:hypothetical protein